MMDQLYTSVGHDGSRNRDPYSRMTPVLPHAPVSDPSSYKPPLGWTPAPVTMRPMLRATHHSNAHWGVYLIFAALALFVALFFSRSGVGEMLRSVF